MFEYNKTQEEAEMIDKTLTEKAVEHINRLRPLFAVMCGDLTHASPPQNPEEAESVAYKRQVELFLSYWGQVDPSIPLVCELRRREEEGGGTRGESLVRGLGWVHGRFGVLSEQERGRRRQEEGGSESLVMVAGTCGNHDLLNVPNAFTLKKYSSVFGDDYYAFWAGFTLNSSCPHLVGDADS
jgi:hypothetical protein